MKQPNPYTGTVRLLDKKLRVVEVLGPEPMGSRRPTDRKLLFWDTSSEQKEYMAGPQPVGLCFQADGRTAKFLVDKSFAGEKLLDQLTKHPNTSTRLARPYGATGWVVDR